MSLRRFLPMLLVFALVLCLPSLLAAQSTDAPQAEIFLGYSWYHMGGQITPSLFNVPDFKKGAGLQVTYNLNRWAGLTADFGGRYNDVFRLESYAVGPKFTYRTEHLMPFVEALYGLQHVDSAPTRDQNSTIFFLGGGLDYKINRHWSIRPFQADYVLTNFSQSNPPGHSTTYNGVRLQAGFSLDLGMPKMEREVTATCSAEPSAVDAGVAVRVSVTPSGFMPKRIVSYSYASTSVKIGGNTGTASVDTTGLAPGTYTVSAKVWDNGKGAHQRSATCQTSFSVNRPPMRGPSLTVSASPASLLCGDS